jgi:hypothetical protein
MQIFLRCNICKFFKCPDIVALVCIAIIISYITQILKLPVVKLMKCPVELMYFSKLIYSATAFARGTFINYFTISFYIVARYYWI